MEEKRPDPGNDDWIQHKGWCNKNDKYLLHLEHMKCNCGFDEARKKAAELDRQRAAAKVT